MPGYEGTALENQVVAQREPSSAELEARSGLKEAAAFLAAAAKAPRYTLDGEPLDLADFIETNELEAEQVAAIHQLQPGETMNFGGGAAATFVLRCEGGGA